MKNLRDVEILIVEDSAIQLEILRRTLAEEGYQVSVAENGAKALEMIRQRKPSLVISDIVMPIMDGYRMCQEIKHDDQLLDIPVILLTDLSDPRDVIRGLNAKADNYVTKPYHAKLLLSKIESLLASPGECRDTVQREPLELNYAGESYFLTSGPRQILNLLISTYENAVHQHQDLIEAQSKLVMVNDELETKLRELQESEQRFSVLVQTIPDIVYRIDNKGCFIFVNNAVRRLGYEPEELIDKHFSEIVFPADVEHVSLDHVLLKYRGKVTGPEGSPKLFDERRTGKRITQNLEVRLISKSKQSSTPAVVESIGTEEVIVEINSSGLYEVVPEADKKLLSGPIRVASEKATAARCLGTVGVVRDITDRKLAEAALHSSEERFRQLVQTAGSVIVLLSPDRIILEWNQEAERVFGQTWDQALGRDFCSLFGSADQRDRMATRLHDVLDGKPVRDFETRQTNQPGTEHILLWNISLMLDTHRSPLGAIAVGQDVTEWKRSEEERLHTKAQSEMGLISAKVAAETIEGMKDAVVITNPEGKIGHFNQGFSLSLGWGKEVIGKSLTQLVVEEDAIAVGQGLEACLSDSVSVNNIECTAITKDGRRVPILLNATMLKDSYGKPSKIITVLRDITELRRAMEKEGDSETLTIEKPIQGGSETILLVDDEESLCDIGSQLLTRAGYTVLTATNARDALDLYRNQKSDISLVFLDLIMPEMGGKECFKELVNINPQVRVILSSGFLSDRTTEEARVFGFRGLVEKPYNMRELLGMVREVLDGD